MKFFDLTVRHIQKWNFLGQIFKLARAHMYVQHIQAQSVCSNFEIQSPLRSFGQDLASSSRWGQFVVLSSGLMWFNFSFPSNECWILQWPYGWAWNETVVFEVKELRLSEAALCTLKMSLALLGLVSYGFGVARNGTLYGCMIDTLSSPTSNQQAKFIFDKSNRHQPPSLRINVLSTRAWAGHHLTPVSLRPSRRGMPEE